MRYRRQLMNFCSTFWQCDLVYVQNSLTVSQKASKWTFSKDTPTSQLTSLKNFIESCWCVDVCVDVCRTKQANEIILTDAAMIHSTFLLCHKCYYCYYCWKTELNYIKIALPLSCWTKPKKPISETENSTITRNDHI